MTAARVGQGLCGWTSDSLQRCGRFYPPRARSTEERLKHYASRFPCVEVDTSYYAIPTDRTVGRWAGATPDGFTFHVKAYGMLTDRRCDPKTLPHEVRDSLPPDLRQQPAIQWGALSEPQQTALWARYNAMLEGLLSRGKLGVVLFQFHQDVRPGEAGRARVEECRRRLRADAVMAVELRSRLWFAPAARAETLRWLRELRCACVAVDELQWELHRTPGVTQRPAGAAGSRVAQIVTELTLTQPALLYVRVHRRVGAERLLPPEALAFWAQRLRELAPRCDRIWLLWGTDHEDQPVVNARRLEQALGGELADPWAKSVYRGALVALLSRGVRGSGAGGGSSAAAAAPDAPEELPPELEAAVEDVGVMGKGFVKASTLPRAAPRAAPAEPPQPKRPLDAFVKPASAPLASLASRASRSSPKAAAAAPAPASPPKRKRPLDGFFKPSSSPLAASAAAAPRPGKRAAKGIRGFFAGAGASADQEEEEDDDDETPRGDRGPWDCALCTFHNPGDRSTCEMCEAAWQP